MLVFNGFHSSWFSRLRADLSWCCRDKHYWDVRGTGLANSSQINLHELLHPHEILKSQAEGQTALLGAAKSGCSYQADSNLVKPHLEFSFVACAVFSPLAARL